MTADFAIHNNTHSSGNGRREILKKLAKGVIKKSVEQENNLRQIFQADEYFTKELLVKNNKRCIPTEYIFCVIMLL